MRFLSSSSKQMALSKYLLVLVVILFLSTMFNVAPSEGKCSISGVFSFGDSNSDTGAKSDRDGPLSPPYGITFFHHPEGRKSDGKLIIDFIAESFGLSLLSPYNHFFNRNYSSGVNFAFDGAPINKANSLGKLFNVSLDIQLQEFNYFKEKYHHGSTTKSKNQACNDSVAGEETITKALYVVDIGQADLVVLLFRTGFDFDKVKSGIPDLVYALSNEIKTLYNLGAKNFWIHGTGPLGCLPASFGIFPGRIEPSLLDHAGCLKPHNDLARYFNLELNEALSDLRDELYCATIIYVDVYSPKYLLFSEPRKYGFEQPLVACCGFGGIHNCSVKNLCGSGKITTACERPWVRVSWDGAHYTEAANKFVFEQISDGAFSDPPLALNMACSLA